MDYPISLTEAQADAKSLSDLNKEGEPTTALSQVEKE